MNGLRTGVATARRHEGSLASDRRAGRIRRPLRRARGWAHGPGDAVDARAPGGAVSPRDRRGRGPRPLGPGCGRTASARDRTRARRAAVRHLPGGAVLTDRSLVRRCPLPGLAVLSTLLLLAPRCFRALPPCCCLIFIASFFLS